MQRSMAGLLIQRAGLGVHGLRLEILSPLPVSLGGCPVELRPALVLSQVARPGADRPLMRLGGMVVCACRTAKRLHGGAVPVTSLAVRCRGKAA